MAGLRVIKRVLIVPLAWQDWEEEAWNSMPTSAVIPWPLGLSKDPPGFPPSTAQC